MFREYIRVQMAELRDVTKEEINGNIDKSISISKFDKDNGSPKKGDKIARNPKSHSDQWLVAEEFFKENFKPKPKKEKN